MFYYCSFSIYFLVCLLLFHLTLFIFSNRWLFTFLVHQGRHVTSFIPPIDFDLDTLAWEVISWLGLYICVSDWSRHTSRVCVWFIFSSRIEESLFISILCSVEFRFVDTNVLIKKTKKKSMMISLFIVAYSTKYSLIFEGGSFSYLSLSLYVSLLRASHSLCYLCFQSDNSLVRVSWDPSLHGSGLIYIGCEDWVTHH